MLKPLVNLEKKHLNYYAQVISSLELLSIQVYNILDLKMMIHDVFVPRITQFVPIDVLNFIRDMFHFDLRDKKIAL